MMQWTFCLTCAIVLSTAFQARAADVNGREFDLIQGHWNVVECSFDGVALPIGQAPNGFFMYVDGAVLRCCFVVNQEPVEVRFFITVGPNALPHAIDARVLTGAWSGRTLKGIYELRGDKLRLCLADRPDSPRPQKLGPNPESQFFVLKRASLESAR
ncbi:MAG: TIGR03067 domain-containing protein [Planctomycetaceae bacterium]